MQPALVSEVSEILVVIVKLAHKTETVAVMELVDGTVLDAVVVVETVVVELMDLLPPHQHMTGTFLGVTQLPEAFISLFLGSLAKK